MGGAPAAAGLAHGKRLILRAVHDVSGLLRLVLGGHSRAPSVAAPPPCTTALHNLRLPRGFFMPRPPRPQFVTFPLPCPKFPCQTRLRPPKTVARAGSRNHPFPFAPTARKRSENSALFSRFPRCGRDGLAPWVAAPSPCTTLQFPRGPRGFLPERGRPGRSGYALARTQQISNALAPMPPLRPGRPRSVVCGSVALCSSCHCGSHIGFQCLNTA